MLRRRSRPSAWISTRTAVTCAEASGRARRPGGRRRRPESGREDPDRPDAQGFELRPGQVGGAGRDLGDRVVVVVDGRPVESAWAFDSVLAPLPPAEGSLGFDGWEVDNLKGTSSIRADRPCLMDFRTHGGLRFPERLLPASPRALVEHTRKVRVGGRADAGRAAPTSRTSCGERRLHRPAPEAGNLAAATLPLSALGPGVPIREQGWVGQYE